MLIMLLSKGFVLGFAIAAAIGPISILCIRKTLQFGKLSGLCTGMGAAIADTFYGMIAAFGLTLISNFLISMRSWLHLIGGLFLVYLGAKIFFSNPVEREEKVMHKTLFWDFTTTIFLTLTNPMTILAYLMVFAGLSLPVGIGYYGAFWIVLGVFLGSTLWWIILSEIVSLFRKKMNQKALIWVNRMSGLIIASFGFFALLKLLRDWYGN